MSVLQSKEVFIKRICFDSNRTFPLYRLNLAGRQVYEHADCNFTLSLDACKNISVAVNHLNDFSTNTLES